MVELDKENLKLFIKPENLSVLNKVSRLLAVQAVKSYLVGGFVRDALLGRGTADIDIAVAADALEVAGGVAGALNGKYVPLDRENRIGRVVLPEGEGQRTLDFSTFEGSIEADLARRDFTIDALAIDLFSLMTEDAGIELIDPFDGYADLQAKLVRAVSAAVFEQDAVRLLRAVRLALELGFIIDKRTAVLIQNQAQRLAGVAGERVREELLRILAVPGIGGVLPYLDGLNLVTAVIPELAQTKGVVQPKEHFWDVFDHSVQTVVAFEFLLREGAWQYADNGLQDMVPYTEVLSWHFAREVSHGSTRRVLLKLAILLHDIAKPQTKAFDDNGRMRFLRHGEEGAAMVAGILERLRFSNEEIKLVTTEVRHHLRPGQMSPDWRPSRRAIYRYFRDTGDAGVDILFLSLADHLATRGPHLDYAQWREHAKMVQYVLNDWFEQETFIAPPKLVDGHDVINIFNISPGPRIGQLLDAVREAQAAGDLTTREAALSYIGELLSAPSGDNAFEEKGG